MRYTVEMQDYLREIIPGRLSAEAAILFNDRFPDTPITASKIQAYRKNHRINCGVSTRFAKGRFPTNKGAKGVYASGSEKGWYQSGNKPHNYKPVGTLLVNTDGYKVIKIGEPNKWKLYHRMVWEEAHGDVPVGCVIVFLDGNKLNCELSNLRLVTKTQLLLMNRRKLFSPIPECTETGILIAKVLETAYDVKKKMKG